MTAEGTAAAESMRAIFFLDDWMLDGMRDVERVFPAPRRETLAGAGDLGMSTIIHDPDLGLFRSWSKLPEIPC